LSKHVKITAPMANLVPRLTIEVQMRILQPLCSIISLKFKYKNEIIGEFCCSYKDLTTNSMSYFASGRSRTP